MAIHDAGRASDAVVLLSVPLLLVTLFVLPRPVKLELALAYRNPTLPTVFVSHFVHLEVAHLLANLVAYLVVVPVIYVLGVLSGRRTAFLIAFVTLVVAFPFVLSGLNLLFPRPRVGYGFSGIAMAFVGLLTCVVWEYLVVQFGDEFDRDRSPVLFFFGTVIIAVRVVPSVPASLSVVGLAIVGSLLYLWPLITDPTVSAIEAMRKSVSYPGYFDTAVLGVFVVVAFPFAAFPSSPVVDGTVLNVYSHALGYCLGYLVPYSAFRVVGLSFE